MGIIILMVIASVSLAAVFLALFLIGAKRGQFDEDESPAVRMLFDDKKLKDKIDT
ncbi:cbb3-type cytochrome oxidase assembly protein CcoS [Moheibacter sediminis]|uniref:Cytochrome oxidase maturation protein, cbb3-type n=1 Tax=Moheibacter sediminis TaxID=1434700 RepID=A0A1W1YIS5_9FLAO|nr:cbb3-type cytochrome oxidase assembly protein CcoS [Moheibacter sediminis]SMC36024.1 cytochrome oxidase maturation protein, cbb3-type [Moheibacter sediminis]